MPVLSHASAPFATPIRGALPAALQFIDLAYLGHGRPVPTEGPARPATASAPGR